MSNTIEQGAVELITDYDTVVKMMKDKGLWEAGKESGLPMRVLGCKAKREIYFTQEEPKLAMYAIMRTDEAFDGAMYALGVGRAIESVASGDKHEVRVAKEIVVAL